VRAAHLEYNRKMQLTDRCFAVTGLGYSTPWSVNAGFVIGDEVTLVVDTGASSLAAQSIHGYASTARPGNKLRVINTEKHFDHIGGNSFFRERGIDVWGHAEIARTPDEFQAEVAEFNDLIPNLARRVRTEAHAFFHNTNLANPNCHIHNDTWFDLGGCTVEVLLTPGHTPTNLSVWVPEESVLFTGDCLIREYLPNLDAGTKTEWELWIESIDRLEELKPKFVVTGHGPISRGVEIQRVMNSVRSVLRESIARGSSPTASIH